MEPKKYPSKDVHRYFPLFFATGLSLSIGLVIISFESWFRVASPDPPYHSTQDEFWFTYYDYPVSALPAEIVHKPQIRPVIPIKVTTETISDEPEPEIVEIPIDVTVMTCPLITTPLLNKDSIYLTPELRPEPINGYDAFYKFLRNNLQYPARARRTQTEGTVYVEFTVNTDGQPDRVRILKGIGQGCDEEAMRVIQLSKWSPAKQGGLPVRCRMVQPITFRIE